MAENDSKLFGAVAYIVNLWVPLFILFTDKKNDKWLAFHAYQALMLLVASVVVYGVLMVATIVLGAVSGGIGSIFGCLLLPLWLVIVGAHLFCAFKAWNGEKYMLPVLGEQAAKMVK
ncbi:MAG: DUF4870 domain-containing protein [Candidatus Bilamarchaeum sp.]